jgi:hypothetical protein
MKIKLILFLLIISQTIIAQITGNPGFIFAREFSKEISLYKAKEFVINEVFGTSDDVVQFEIDPLAATSSGEVTSLVYSCKKNNKEGLLLGFYGYYWNEQGVVYQGYNFKILPTDKAFELLNKITQTLEKYQGYLIVNNANNVYFKYDDITVLLYTYTLGEPKIRLFWGDFDAEWDVAAVKRTKKRFEKSLN